MFGKKKRLGIAPKVRTIDEINADYNHHAAQAGHKQRLINEIQGEIDQHLFRLSKINDEAKALPKPDPSAQQKHPLETPPEGTLTKDQEHA